MNTETSANLVELRLITRNARLLDSRSKNSLTQKELATITGIQRTTLSQIENLRLIPTREIMEEIANALDEEVDFLFPPELLEAIEEGVFDKRKVWLESQHLITFSEAKRLQIAHTLTSGDENEKIEEEVDATILDGQLKQALNSLKPQERRVLELRFGLGGGVSRTLDDVGLVFGVTAERIRQIEYKSLSKLRHPKISNKLWELWKDK